MASQRHFLAILSRRLLFATTNHIERLDPALSRPGRMDVWVNFTNATKWQAEGIFKCFFPCKASQAVRDKEAKEAAEAEAEAEAESAASEGSKPISIGQKNLPVSKRKASTHAVPILDEDELNVLAKRFAEQIPDDEMSVRLYFLVLFSPANGVAMAIPAIRENKSTKQFIKIYFFFSRPCSEYNRWRVYKGICSRTRHARVRA